MERLEIYILIFFAVSLIYKKLEYLEKVIETIQDRVCDTEERLKGHGFKLPEEKDL